MFYAVPDLLLTLDRQTQSRIAIIDGDERISYTQLAERAARYGALLSTLKVSAGDRVALLLPRSIETAAAFFGAQMSGTIVVFISDRLRPHQIAQIIADSEPAAVLTTPRLRPLLKGSLRPDRIHDS